MKNMTLIALVLSFMLYVPFAFSQTIAECEVTEELEIDIELFKKANNWFYEMTGSEGGGEISQQQIQGFCLVKLSVPDTPTIWYSNKSSVESPIDLSIEVYENGDLLFILSPAHPEKVEDYISAVNSFEKIRDFFDWDNDRTKVKNENVVLSYSEIMQIEINIEIEEGETRYEIDRIESDDFFRSNSNRKHPMLKFLQGMSLANESVVQIDGITYKIDEEIKKAIGEMIFLWENHWNEFQY